MVQTRDGYLWLGTFGGLARFDGVKFTIFDTGNSPRLGGNRITYLYEDKEGGLWIAFESGGLSRFHDGRFVTYTVEHGLPDSRVVRLAEGRDGTLWATTALGTARLEQGRFVTDEVLFGLPNNNLVYYLQSRDGSVWLGPLSGLVRWHQNQQENHLSRPALITESVDGSIWTYRRDRGFDQLLDGRWIHYPVVSDVPGGESGKKTAFVGRDQSICILTAEGVTRFREGRRVSFTKLPGLPDWRVALEDREGNLWIGSNGLGLYRFKEPRVTAYAGDEGLSDDMFLTITDDTRGGLWLGGGTLSPTGISKLFHHRDGVFTAYPFEAIVWALQPDSEGGLWLGEYGKLRRLVDGRLTEFKQFEGTPVLALAADPEGVLWVGTIAGHVSGSAGGLYRYQGGHFTPIRTAEGLVHNNVRVIRRGRDGTLWVGTEGGLSRFHDGKFINYTTKDGLSNGFILDIYEDADRTLWIGTYGGGLSRFKDGRFAQITTGQGLFDNFVSRIIEDDGGHFWICSNHGIYRTSRADVNAVADGRLQSVPYTRYGAADGMKTSECSAGGQPAGWKARDGKLWFPTLRGVVVIDPTKVDSAAPPVAIEQVFVDTKPISASERLQAAPGTRDFEFHYTGLSLASPEKVLFRYRLDGYDEGWVEAGTRRTAYYTNIRPGDYTFRVTASNGDGVWNATGASFSFRLRPRFHQTMAFQGAALLGCAGLLWIGYDRRITYLRRRHAQQQAFSRELIESQERERKRIAGELHDSLGQNLLIIKNRALLGSMAAANRGAVEEQLDAIDASVTRSIEEVRQLAYNLRPYHLDRLGLTQALEEMVERVAAASGIRFSTQIDAVDGLFDKDAEISVYRIAQESINNIVKHSAATEASVRVLRRNRTVRITITDNGRGLPPGMASSGEPRERGFGLAGIAERVRILGGTTTLQSAPGEGTVISVEIDAAQGSGGQDET